MIGPMNMRVTTGSVQVSRIGRPVSTVSRILAAVRAVHGPNKTGSTTTIVKPPTSRRPIREPSTSSARPSRAAIFDHLSPADQAAIQFNIPEGVDLGGKHSNLRVRRI